MSKGKVHKSSSGGRIHAVMGEFASPADLTHAAERFRDAGFTRWDVFSPFPVHGMDDAMGLKPTKLPLLVGVLGLTGAGLGFLFQWWVRTQGYATVVQGKPYGAWEPLIPVTFEFGVIFTAFSALIGMLAFNALPRFHHPLLTNERFLGVSDDKFVIAVEAKDPKFDPSTVRAMMEKCKAVAVETVEE